MLRALRAGLLLGSSHLRSLKKCPGMPARASSFGCFQPCWFFQMLFPSFWFVGALYVTWVSFAWVYFLFELFFFFYAVL
jgi:hypothetical protein